MFGSELEATESKFCWNAESRGNECKQVIAEPLLEIVIFSTPLS